MPAALSNGRQQRLVMFARDSGLPAPLANTSSCSLLSFHCFNRASSDGEMSSVRRLDALLGEPILPVSSALCTTLIVPCLRSTADQGKPLTSLGRIPV